MRYIVQLTGTQVKYGDDADIFQFQLWESSSNTRTVEDSIVDLTGSVVTVDIANGSGFVGRFVTTTIPEKGIVNIDMSNEVIASLPADTYYFQVEVANGTRKKIFPTDGGDIIKIFKSLTETQGELVPQVTFDAVLTSVDEKISEYTKTIAKGDKGDTGEQGPQGERGKQVFKSSSEYYDQNSLGHWWSDLTPAVSGDNPPKIGDTIITSSGDVFQINTVNVGDGGGGGGTFGVGGLLGNIKGPQGPKGDTGEQGPKGDMDLSQITVGGRNLVLGTSEQVVQAKHWNMEVANINYDKSLGRTLYASVLISNADHASDLHQGSSYIVLESFDKSGNILKAVNGNSVLYNANGISQCSINMDDNTASVRVRIRTNNMSMNTYYSRLKVERGNVPTDWTPAPEDADNAYVKDTRLASGITDFNLVMGKAWSGKWYKVGGHWSNEPAGASNYLQFEYTPGDTDLSGILEIRDWTTNRRWMRTVSARTWSNWVEIANDANVVHKTGTETIAGDKTLTGKTSLSGGFTFNLTDLGEYHVDGITDSGSYTSNGTLLGLPISPAYGILEVESNTTDTKQTFTQTNIDQPVSWTRVKNSNIGGWSKWSVVIGYSNLNTLEIADDPSLIDLYTDKTIYGPYEAVTFKGYPSANSGKVKVEYWKREQKIGTQTVSFSSSEVTWRWYLPSDDNEQYIAKIMVYTEGGRTSTQYYAINVASNSNNLPIMGFLSNYTTYNPKAQKRVMDWLKRTHMNYIQYYDSYYRPENFLAVDDTNFREGVSDENPEGIGMAGTAADYWTDLSSHTVRKDVLQKYVELGQEYGMKNMLYIPWGNTSYVDTEHGITPEMLLFPTPEDAAAHNVKSVQATLSGGDGQWARYSLMKANPSSNEFKNMLFTSAEKALQSVGFDGLHIDTLGPIYGGVYTVDGSEYSNDFAASTGMPYFINDAANFFNTDTWKKQGKDIRMSFNNVGSWGIGALANNKNIDYLYAEQWPDMGNKTYDNMFQHVKDIITADERGRAIIPAYIHKGFEGDGSFDVNGVILLDLIIMAAGGTHLELGEHMLRGEYFPQTGMSIGDYLKEWLTQYYDFLVAYRRMFTSRNFTNSITSSSHDIAVNSIDPSKLSVIEKSDEFIQSLSLINTKGLNGDEWQDNKLDRNKPDTLSNVSLKFDFTPKAVYYVTIENPIPQALNVTNNSVTVPSVDRYVMVYAYK